MNPRPEERAYVYRVLLTGIQLMRTGEVEANIVRLNEDARLSQIPELVARKLAGPEKATLDDADVAFHEVELARLRRELEEAGSSSSPAEEPTPREAAERLRSAWARISTRLSRAFSLRARRKRSPQGWCHDRLLLVGGQQPLVRESGIARQSRSARWRTTRERRPRPGRGRCCVPIGSREFLAATLREVGAALLQQLCSPAVLSVFRPHGEQQSFSDMLVTCHQYMRFSDVTLFGDSRLA
jgi:hypothetical protein